MKNAESKEPMIIQDYSDIHGNFSGAPIVGTLGGVLNQIALILSTAMKNYEEPTADFFNRKSITQFLNQFIGSQMKFDFFNFLVGKKLTTFLEGLETPVPITELSKIDAATADRIREFLTENSNLGNPVTQLVKKNLEKLGINAEAFDLVYDCFWDIIMKKPCSNEGNCKI